MVRGRMMIYDYFYKKDIENIGEIEGVNFRNIEEILEYYDKKFSGSNERDFIDYMEKHYVVIERYVVIEKEKLTASIIIMGNTIYVTYPFINGEYRHLGIYEIGDAMTDKIKVPMRYWVYGNIFALVSFIISIFVSVYSLVRGWKED
jgi:hypothetical protein